MAGSKDRADAVLSQVKLVIRPMYAAFLVAMYTPRGGERVIHRVTKRVFYTLHTE